MLTHLFRTVSLEAYSSADHLMKKVMSNLSASTADLMRSIFIIQDSLWSVHDKEQDLDLKADSEKVT